MYVCSGVVHMSGSVFGVIEGVNGSKDADFGRQLTPEVSYVLPNWFLAAAGLDLGD